MSEQKPVKFTWMESDESERQLILRHDNRIQGLVWQRVTDTVLALQQCGFIERVYRHPDDDKVYVFDFHNAPTLDNLRFCQQYVETTINALKANWYKGMQLTQGLNDRLRTKTKVKPSSPLGLIHTHAKNLQQSVDSGAINYRQAFEALKSAVTEAASKS